MNVSHAVVMADRETARGPGWSAVQAIAGVTLALSFFIVFWAMTRVTFAGTGAWRLVGLGRAVRAHPYIALFAGYIALFAMSYGWNAAATWWVSAMPFALSAWFAMRVVAVSVKNISEGPTAIIIPAKLQPQSLSQRSFNGG